MAFNRRTALQAAAALAAAGTAITGGVDATPADPIVEEIAPPTVIVGEATPEDKATDLYDQIDDAYEQMENGEEPVIIVGIPSNREENESGDEDIVPSIPGIAGNSESKEPVEGIPGIAGDAETDIPSVEIPSVPTVDDADEMIEETPAEAPSTGNTDTPVIVGRPGGRRGALAAAAENAAKNPVASAPSTGTLPTVRPGYGEENKVSDDANWGSSEQDDALQAFMDEHPTGSAWDGNSWYKNFAGCSAYARQLQDIAYESFGTTKYVDFIRDRYQVRQYDIVNVGGHEVFVLEVLPEENSIRTAEGNFNGKTFNEGVWSIDKIISIERPRLAA